MRRFHDVVGLGADGYPLLLALALFAWHSQNSKGRDARRVLREVLVGPDWYRSRAVREILDSLSARGYLDFQCQTPMKPGNWRRCTRDWKVTEEGYKWLKGKLSNLGLTLEDVLVQPNPLEVKKIIDSRIKQFYRVHWGRVRRYEEVAREAGL